MAKGDQRPDLVPTCCTDCRAEVVDGTNELTGSPTFWAQHNDTSHECASGAEALQWIAEQHQQAQAPVEGKTTLDGSTFNNTGTGTSTEIEGAPV